MGPKLNKSLFMSAILILVAVAAVLALRICLPWSFLMSDRFIYAVEIPTIIPVTPAIQVATPSAISAPINSIGTSTPDPGQASRDIPCFVFEQLPAFAFLPDRSGILVRANQGVQLFNLETGSLEKLIKSSQNLTAAALSPDGETLAWALDDYTVQLVRISDQEVLHSLPGHTDLVTKLSFTPDGDYLVSASHDRTVRVWSLSGDELRSIQTDALGLGISPDGSMLATIPFDGPVALWDLATGEKIKDFSGPGGYDTTDAVFSPDGQYLAADLATGLFLWKISDGSAILSGGINTMAVAFSPDGRYLAYTNIGDNNKVVLAAPETGQFMRVIDQMQSPIWELTFSPDASLIAVTDGREIHILQVEDGAMLAVGKAACP